GGIVMADDRAVSPLASGRLPRLTHEQLRQAQREASASPRRRYGIAARVLFTALDVVYGKPRTLSKFKVVELVARVPYQSPQLIRRSHESSSSGCRRRSHSSTTSCRGCCSCCGRAGHIASMPIRGPRVARVNGLGREHSEWE